MARRDCGLSWVLGRSETYGGRYRKDEGRNSEEQRGAGVTKQTNPVMAM